MTNTKIGDKREQFNSDDVKKEEEEVEEKAEHLSHLSHFWLRVFFSVHFSSHKIK